MTINDIYQAKKYITQDDVEKRRKERDRARKLSAETNKRRKALEARKKQAAEREQRKISMELSKRRQKQSEATEKYQRAHLSPSRTRSSSPRNNSSRNSSPNIKRNTRSLSAHGMPSLDNILSQLRSGNTTINYGLPSKTNKYSAIKNTKNKPEGIKLKRQQMMLLEQHKLKTKQEFKNELKRNESKNKFETITYPFNGINQNLRDYHQRVLASNKEQIETQPTKNEFQSPNVNRRNQMVLQNGQLFIRNQNNTIQRSIPTGIRISQNDDKTVSPENISPDNSFQISNTQSTAMNEKLTVNELQSESFSSNKIELCDSIDGCQPNSFATDSSAGFEEDSLHGSTTSFRSPENFPPSETSNNNNNKQLASDVSTGDTSTEKKVTFDNQVHFKSYRPRSAIKTTPRPNTTQATKIKVVEPWAMKIPEKSWVENILDPPKSLLVPSAGVTSPEENQVEPVRKVKGILKKVSKYPIKQVQVGRFGRPTSEPRSQPRWKDGIGVVEQSGGDMTSSKSVKWNEIQYDDGTRLDLNKNKSMVNLNGPQAPDSKLQDQKDGKGGRKKGNSPMKRASTKNKKFQNNRGGGVATKESNTKVEMAQHSVLSSKLSSSEAVHYSIDNPLKDEIKIAWSSNSNSEKVGLENLKSNGNQDVVTQEKCGNHTTVTVVSSEEKRPEKISENILTRTPTDQEINQLWENVRAVIQRRPKKNEERKPTKKYNDNYKSSIQPSARVSRVPRYNGAWTSAQSKPSIVSIDGGMLSKPVGPPNSDRGTYQRPVHRGRRIVMRPQSAAFNSAPMNVRRQSDSSSNFYFRHQALLQQRKHRKFISSAYNNDHMAPSFKTYPGVKSSHTMPTPSPRTFSQDANQVSANQSFLLAEQLAEEDLNEDEILQVLKSIQQKSHHAKKMGTTLNPSALSIEEQKLLKSLENLNSRLQQIENNLEGNPSYVPQNNKVNYKKPESPYAERSYQKKNLKINNMRMNNRIYM